MNLEPKQVPFVGTILKAIACTPNQNFDEQDYIKKVIEPTRQIRTLREKYGDQNPSEQEMRDLLRILENILIAKRVDSDEISRRLSEIRQKHPTGNTNTQD